MPITPMPLFLRSQVPANSGCPIFLDKNGLLSLGAKRPGEKTLLRRGLQGAKSKALVEAVCKIQQNDISPRHPILSRLSKSFQDSSRLHDWEEFNTTVSLEALLLTGKTTTQQVSDTASSRNVELDNSNFSQVAQQASIPYRRRQPPQKSRVRDKLFPEEDDDTNSSILARKRKAEAPLSAPKAKLKR